MHIQDGSTVGGNGIVAVGFTIAAPIITSPLDGSSGIVVAPIVTTGTMVGDGAHILSYYELSLDPTFATTVYSTVGLTDLNSHDMAQAGVVLTQGLAYYIRVRFESNLAPISAWSAVTSFTTVAAALSKEIEIVYPANPAGGDRSGHSIAISGDNSTMAVGSYLGDNNQTDEGAVDIYKSVAGKWVWNDILESDPKNSNPVDHFGYSVALNFDGTICAVGAPLFDDGGNDDGAVIIFEDNGGWAEQDLLAGTGNDSDQFGIDVRLSDDGIFCVIGADLDDVNGTSSGNVWVFEGGVGNWDSGTELNPGNHTTGDHLGTSVSISGDTNFIIAGSYLSDTLVGDGGEVTIFENQGSNWPEVATLSTPNPELYGYFGFSVDISADGSVAVVGAYGEDINGSNAGGAYIFEQDLATNTWGPAIRIVPSEIAAGDNFGRSVNISGDGSTILIGSYASASYRGSAYVFTKDSGAWAQSGSELTASNSSSYDYYGFSGAIGNDGTVGAVGAFGEGTNGNEAGAVYALG